MEYSVTEDGLMNLAEKLPIPVRSSQQKMATEILISLPWNWVRNSRITTS
jgi:hypothetical protein